MKRVLFLFLCFSVVLYFSPVVAVTTAATPAKVVAKSCQCGPNCTCAHCKTGKGECMCKAEVEGCTCGPNCTCAHCKTGKGECACKAEVRGCTCGPNCTCVHCKTGKGKCGCRL